MPPAARAPRRSSAQEGVALGGGLHPDGVVRVGVRGMARRRTGDGQPIPGGHHGPRHRTRRPRAHRRTASTAEHAPAASRRPRREEPPDGHHRRVDRVDRARRRLSSSFLASAIKVVREYQRLVVFRLGRVIGVEGTRTGAPDPVRRQGRRRWTCASSTWRSLGRLRSPRTTRRSRSTSSCSTRCSTRRCRWSRWGTSPARPRTSPSTTLRSVVGDMSLDDVLAKREQMNELLRAEARRGHRALGREGHERRDPRDHPAADRAGGDDATDVGRADASRGRDRGRGREAGRDHGEPRATRKRRS